MTAQARARQRSGSAGRTRPKGLPKSNREALQMEMSWDRTTHKPVPAAYKGIKREARAEFEPMPDVQESVQLTLMHASALTMHTSPRRRSRHR